MTDGFREHGRRLSNWGRWGDDDALGTLNLITPERRAAMGMFGFSILYLFALFSALLAEQSFGLFRPVLG